jgi:Folate-dependent phosphoribosylglycinamide formyltransferase PurN
MKILSKTFIDKFPGKIINIHPSLLPKYKGLNTHRRAIENNETVAGCTVHYVNENLDDGEIVLQKEIRINNNDTEHTLADKVLKEEHIIYPEAIKLVLKK